MPPKLALIRPDSVKRIRRGLQKAESAKRHLRRTLQMRLLERLQDIDHCAVGYNDQYAGPDTRPGHEDDRYPPHLTNRCAGQTVQRRWVRLTPTVVLLVPLCSVHEVGFAGRFY